MKHKLEFQNIPWKNIGIGAKQKLQKMGKNAIRLLKLEDGFVEDNWCSKGHIGIVLNGEMTIDFSGKKTHYKTGDVFVIESGESNKHKAIIEKGNVVELFLIENN